MKLNLKYLFVAGALFFSAACSTDASKSQSASETPDLPATKELPISIEGNMEAVTANLYQAPNDYPLQFHAYIPENFTTTREKSGEADILLFQMGGATLKLMAFSELVNKTMATGLVKSMIQSEGELITDTVNGFTRYRLDGDPEKSIIAEVGQHRKHAYIWWREYPPEYGDGFGPRAQLIIENIVWEKRK